MRYISYYLTEPFKWLRHDLPTGISNLIRWFPTIWSDRNWDHTFIYMMLRNKLKNQEQYIRKYGIHLYAERDADNMKVCILLLDRLIEDNYHVMAFKRHDEKWGEANMTWPDYDAKPGYSILKIDRPNVNTEKEKAQERKEFRTCSKHEGYLIQQDLDLLFKTMRKHIQAWWD